MTLRKRLQHLEDPRSPQQKRRDEERRRHALEYFERQDAAYKARAEERPDLFEQLLEALEEFHEDLRRLGVDPDDHTVRGNPNHPIQRDPEFRKAVRKYATMSGKFWNEGGYSCGITCEDCGRAGELPKDGSAEGGCYRCGGVVSYEGNFYKHGRPLDGLKADIAISRKNGHDSVADRLERLLMRRLRDVGG